MATLLKREGENGLNAHPKGDSSTKYGAETIREPPNMIVKTVQNIINTDDSRGTNENETRHVHSAMT